MGFTKWEGIPLPFYWRVLRIMDYLYFKRKDGSVFGKADPTDQQVKDYKKSGCVVCDETGTPIGRKKKSKK